MRKHRDLDLDLTNAKVLQTKLQLTRLPEVAPSQRQDRYEVVIPGWLPIPLNLLMRGSLRQRMRLEKKSHLIVGDACRAAGVAPALQRRKVSLSIGLGPGQQEFDRDSPYKALLDSLVGCGALLTDRVSGVEIGYLEFYRTKQATTTLILEDWPV